MVNARELRQGNIVNFSSRSNSVGSPDGIDVIVEGTLKDTISVLCDNFERQDLFDPIPITPYWLERFGFNHYTTPANIIGSPDGRDGSDEGWLLNTLHIKKFGNDFQTVDGIFVKIQSVHQLQNIYHSVSGHELKLRPLPVFSAT